MRHILRVIFLVCAVLACTAAIQAAEYIWFEGEAPSQNPLNAPSQAAKKSEYLSEGKWLNLSIPAGEVAKSVPEEGAMIGYTFKVNKTGKYEIWNRVGNESARSTFDWRVGDGEWKTIPKDDYPYTDMIDTGLWSEVVWIKLGETDLKEGSQTLQIRVLPPFEEQKKKGADGKEVTVKKPKQIVYFADCFCLSMGEFRPNGKHKPDAAWMTEDDNKAATQVFEMKTGDKAEGRITTPLAGLWQVCRFDEYEPADRIGPDKVLPDAAKMAWSAITVPGDKRERGLKFAHRVVYRTRIQVPAEAKGRSFFLRFPSNNMISSVFVNGRFCDWTQVMLAPWDCDITPALKPGETNEVAVVIKDSYYAHSPEKDKKQKRAWHTLAYEPETEGICMDFPVDTSPQAGILETPSLVACSGVYVTDVFAKPSVKTKELGLEITLKNPGATAAAVRLEVAVEPLVGGAAEKTFSAQELKLGPGKEEVFNLAEAWGDPKLWWPDAPHLYVVVTRVSVGGVVVDVQRTKFGFREWEWNSSQFKLNGIPWHGRADITEAKTLEESLKIWRDRSQTMMRLWHQPGQWKMTRTEILDILDKEGMVVRFTGIFDGQRGNYWIGLNDQTLFDRWTKHLEQWTKAYRNHPSILIWGLDNEIIYVNARIQNLLKSVEPMMAQAGKRVMEIDPTRPVMVDGGRCLVAEDLPVNGCHYDEANWREYPDEAYTLAVTYKSHEIADWKRTKGVSPWRMVPDRPIFMGESYFQRGYTPPEHAQFGGEVCFTGWKGAMQASGLFAKILSEGFRWHGVAAMHFWLSSDQATPYYNSWKPVAVLCREWNWTFAGGSTVERTLKILNDTRYPEPIEMSWSLMVGDKPAVSEKKPYTVAPGMGLEVKIRLPIPLVKERTRGELVLTCSRGGKELFRDVKELWLIDPEAGPKPGLQAGELAVLDPNGSVKARLVKRAIPFTEIKKGEDIPAAAKVVVVGADALDADGAKDTRWKALAARGVRVLVLDQTTPLQLEALPADLEATTFAGRIAFAEILGHPAFQGLDQADFFTWSKDHLVYRNVYRKATRGATSLAHCDRELNYSCLAECQMDDGLLLLCQMLVGTKLETDPVAGRLFDNLLAYAANYQVLRKATALTFGQLTPRGKLLSGLVFESATDPLTAIKEGKCQIVVADATPENLKALAGSRDAIKTFTQQGGWLFLWGLTPEGLADFNRVVEVEHLIRPFGRERVTLPVKRDSLLTGISLKDVVMDTGQKLVAWRAEGVPAADIFNFIVDYDDIAPFCKFPDWRYFYPNKNSMSPDNDPRNMVNGFTRSDDWRYVFSLYTNSSKLEFDLELPREETPVQLDLIPNAAYNVVTKIELTFDGDTAKPMTLDLNADGSDQSIMIPNRPVKVLHVKFADWKARTQTDVIGVDNIWLKVKRTPEFYSKVKPLLNIGGLVKYPRGAGGVILCQLHVPEREVNPINAEKKGKIVSALLRNIGAVFTGDKKDLASMGLNFETIPLNDSCNQFLTKDKGWFADEKRDLGHFPVGEQKFAGVSYLVRDFRTSPVPCAIALAKGMTDQPQEVKGIQVGKKADCLFFLHTWYRTTPWRASRGDNTPPVIFKYVVRYADGQSVEVPVRYGEGVDHWIQPKPVNPKEAVVAWAAPFPNEMNGEQAVVYQMQWTNPNSGKVISTIDIAYDDKVRSQFGVPIFLAVTAASDRK